MAKLPKGALGYKDDMDENELVGKHIDGVTGLVFDSEEEYLNHVSPETGYTPRDVEHLGPQFAAVSQAALERGEARKGEKTHPAAKKTAGKGKK